MTEELTYKDVRARVIVENVFSSTDLAVVVISKSKIHIPGSSSSMEL